VGRRGRYDVGGEWVSSEVDRGKEVGKE